MIMTLEFWKEGANARVRNVPMAACPYPTHKRTQRKAWLEGWEDAEKFEFLIAYVGPAPRQPGEGVQ